jgi:hypothetical protein
MPNLDLVTADGLRRVFTLLHEARPVLLNLGEPGARDIAACGSGSTGRRSIRGCTVSVDEVYDAGEGESRRPVFDTSRKADRLVREGPATTASNDSSLSRVSGDVRHLRGHAHATEASDGIARAIPQTDRGSSSKSSRRKKRMWT